MCSRFAQYSQDLELHLATALPYLDPKPRNIDGLLPSAVPPLSTPSFNIPPGDVVPVLRRAHKRRGGFVNVLQRMKFGVIPRWDRLKGRQRKITFPTHNVKAQDIISARSNLWNPLVGQRCVVPVNGWFAWTRRQRDSKAKTAPHYLKLTDDRTVLLAALWEETFIQGDPAPTYTFAIITVPSPTRLKFLGDRMPVLLTNEDDVQRWLDPDNADLDPTVLRAYDAEDLTFHRVHPEMGNARYKNPSCIKPIVGIDVLLQRQLQATQDPMSSQTVVIDEEEVEVVLEEDEEEDVARPGTSKRPIEVLDDDDDKENEGPRQTKRARTTKGKGKARQE